MKTSVHLSALIVSALAVASQAQDLRLGIQKDPASAVTVVWPGLATNSYNLQASANLAAPWKSVAGLITGQAPITTLGLAATNHHAFYRLVQVQKIISLVETNSGGSIQLGSGDILELKLSSNPSTGYLWAVAADSADHLNLIAPPGYIPGQGVGSSGKQVFQFELLARTTGVLKLNYRRSFDPPTVPPVQTFEVTVIGTP